MKVTIVVALLCVVACASAEHICQCSSFFSTHVDDAHKLHTAPNVEMTSCDTEHANECKTACQAKYNKLTDNGNLNHITSKGTTVAEWSCDVFKADVHDGQTGVYYKMCDGAWTHIQDTQGKTCCTGGHSVACH